VVPLEAARRRLAALVPDLIDWASIQHDADVMDEESKDAPSAGLRWRASSRRRWS
jgi:hypothetical protein